MSNGLQDTEAVLDRDIGVAVKRLLDPTTRADDARKEVKHLAPNTTMAELKEVAAAFLQPNPAPSYSTFTRVFSKSFARVLRWRAESQHAKCNDCERFKAYRRSCSTFDDAARVSKAYLEHLQAVVRDRAADAQWRLKGSCAMTTGVADLNAEEKDSTSWLSITIDGMDCSKFAVPLNIAKSKEFSKMERPELRLTLGMSDGHEEAFYLQDPTLIGSANVDLTIIADMISESYQTSQDRGIPFPTGLRIHADNCSSEVRNQTTLKMACFLIHHRVFNQVCLTFFRVGHSHGAPDQRFAEVRHHLFSENVLQTPVDFMTAIKNVKPRGNRTQRIQKLDSVFDFNSFFQLLEINVSGHTSTRGKLKLGQHPAHVFHLASRKQMVQYISSEAFCGELQNNFPYPPHEDDIIMFCKLYLADPGYTQAGACLKVGCTRCKVVAVVCPAGHGDVPGSSLGRPCSWDARGHRWTEDIWT